MKKAMLIMFAILISSNIFPDITIKTPEGRTVVLKDDYTWHYIKEKEIEQIDTSEFNGAILKLINIIEFETEDEYFTPDEGFKYVAIEVVIDNMLGSNTIELNIFMTNFELKDSDGYSYKPGIMVNSYEPELDPNGVIDSGDILRGWVTFEVRQEVDISDIKVRLVGKYPDVKSDWMYKVW